MTDIVFAHQVIQHVVGNAVRGESLNIGILLWNTTTGDYRVAIDAAAMRRARSVDAADQERWGRYDARGGDVPLEQQAEDLRAFICERIDRWAEKPLTDAGIRAWIEYPHFGDYSVLRWGNTGATYLPDGWREPRDLEWHLARLMARLVTPLDVNTDANTNERGSTP